MSTGASERSERSRRRWTDSARSNPLQTLNSLAFCDVYRTSLLQNLHHLCALTPSSRVNTANSALARDSQEPSSMPYPPKRFVYIIRSVDHPERRYVGVTADLTARLAAHNAGQNRSTVRWKPWFIDVCIEFRTAPVATRFERFLKSGAGHAFAMKHFVGD
jgi:putative endonuclease